MHTYTPAPVVTHKNVAEIPARSSFVVQPRTEQYATNPSEAPGGHHFSQMAVDSDNAVQKKDPEEDDKKTLQGRFATVQRKSNDTGLPDNLKSGVESLSGMSMDAVKVHYNSSEPSRLGALAYAQGSDIHVSPGQERHLPHEAWHVVQQAQGRVRPTMQLPATQLREGVPVNDDAGLEREADVMGEKALTTPVQRMEDAEEETA